MPDASPPSHGHGSSLPGAAAREWRAHWTVVLAGVIGVSIAAVHIYVVGIFIAPLEQAFGWSRAEISSGLFLFSVIAVLFTPFSGMACDRFGPRRVAIFGAVAYSIALAMLSFTSGDLRIWWALWLVLSLAQLFVSAAVWVTGVVSFFSASRGLAIAVTLSGTGLTGIIAPPLANMLIELLGWRGAYQALGVIWLLCILPFILLFFTSAQDKGRAGGTAMPTASPAGIGVREAIRSTVYLRIAIGTMLVAFGSVSMGVNIVPILQGNGLERQVAVGMASIVGVGMIVGRIAVGHMLDRFESHIVAAGSVILPIFSAGLLLFLPHSPPAAFCALFVLGLAVGAELDIAGYLTGQHFGLQSFGALFGSLVGMVALAAGVGPTIVNLIYDLGGSYRPFLWACLPLCLLASLSFLSLGRAAQKPSIAA